MVGLVRTKTVSPAGTESAYSPFAARKAVHAASVGRRMVELLGVPTIGSVALTRPALVCRSVTLAMPATNCCAVH